MKPWIQLIRPSNTLTAISDVLAGVALACLFIQANLPASSSLILISISSMLLYIGGIVFNDVFDAKLDALERPERPIPSGRLTKGAATSVGSIAFILGCLFSFFINYHTFFIAVAIAGMCLLYNRFAKHHFILGPIAMGICRGLNLLLGLSYFPEALSYWYIGLIPVVYIASVTNISRGEVYGNNQTAMIVSAFLYIIIFGTLLSFSLNNTNYFALVFVAAFVYMIFNPLLKALKSLNPLDVRSAVKSGVLALILMNASWIAIAGFWVLALGVCAILPISIFLAKKYAVT